MISGEIGISLRWLFEDRHLKVVPGFCLYTADGYAAGKKRLAYSRERLGKFI